MLGHNASAHDGPIIVGTNDADTVRGGSGVIDIRGWAGDDHLFAGLRGGSISGGRGSDTIYMFGVGAPLSQQFQTHAYGDWDNDAFYLGMARYGGDTYASRFGHHVFGGHGADRFIFSGVTDGNQRITGRIDDFDPTQDSIWVENIRLNLNDLPENVRIVQHLGQQWILIDGRILYALEGARHASPTIETDDRNSESSEENHFIYWPDEWADGVPKSADIAYYNVENFVPARFLNTEVQFDHYFSNRSRNVSGTPYNDRIEGSPDYGQNLSGLAGHDFVFGNRGDDTIHGGDGDDYIDGYHGHDKIFGGVGNDDIDGGKGHDLILGGVGHDVTAGGSDNDTIHGGLGNDTMFGGSENDIISGESGNDVLSGSSGNDRLNGGYGADIVHGGHGLDSLWGGAGNDRLSGNKGNDTIYGCGGDDYLYGGLGNDILSGSVGIDRLQGDAGADIFVFLTHHDSRPGPGRDVIVDFTSDEDRIDLSRLDADPRKLGNQVFTFSDTGPAGHAVWLFIEERGVSLRGDLDGDGIQDFAIWLSSINQVRASDFIL